MMILQAQVGAGMSVQHAADGVDLTQIREMLALSVEERLHWLELSVNSQLALQENIKAKSKSALK